MAVELGGVTVQGVTDVSVRERTRLVHHAVPGAGDLVHVLGRGAIEVSFSGVCHGPDAESRLRRLREARISGEPVDFVADAVGEGFAAAGPALLDMLGRDVLGGMPGGMPGFAEFAATTGAATGMTRGPPRGRPRHGPARTADRCTRRAPRDVHSGRERAGRRVARRRARARRRATLLNGTAVPPAGPGVPRQRVGR